MMDASRVEFELSSLDLRPLVLKDISVAVVDLFEPWLLKERRSVHLKISADLVVLADETRLKQILHNLFANALRYSAPLTPLQIVAERDEEQKLARIQVIDRGLGIPSDKQQAIFERFVRLKRDMHGDVRGSGLGLYITRQLVEAMRGTISVESSGIPEEGSTFCFTLPLVSSDESPLFPA
jgi:signal transduction histidine kinase